MNIRYPIYEGVYRILTLFLVQFVYFLLVLFQMLAQHGVHVAAYRDFTPGDVVHDFENLAVDVTADIDALARLYLVAAEEQPGIVVLLPFAADGVPLRFFLCRVLHGRRFRLRDAFFFGSRRGRLLRVVQGPVLPASADGGYQQFLVNAFGVHFPAAHDY